MDEAWSEAKEAWEEASKRLLAPAESLYRCPLCFDWFSLRVWHCPGCDHHLDPDLLRECKYCRKFSLDDDDNVVYEGDPVVAMTEEEWEKWDDELMEGDA